MKHFIAIIAFFSLIILSSCKERNEPSTTTTKTPTPTTTTTTKKDYTLGSVTDICGNKYTYINFNGKTWMAQNMRCNKYDTKSEQSSKTLSTSTKNYAPCYIDASERYNWDEESKKNGTNLTDEQILQLGYLYSWSAAVGLKSYDEAKEKTYFSYTRQGICPNGWHIPTKSDWVESETNGKKLKSTTGWYNGDSEYKAGSDSYGFSALPAGYCSVSSSGSNYIKDLGTYAYFWTVDPEVTTGILGYKNSSGAFARLMGYSYDELFSISHTKTAALSVRCVKDEYQMSKVNLSLDKTEISIQVKTNTTITATTNTTDEIVWTTSNANIATITTDGKKCTVNGIAIGEVEIKAEVAGVEAVCKVRVLSKESQTDNEDSGSDENIYDDIKSITLNKSELQLAIGQSETLVATVTNTSGVVIRANVDWTSLNPAIATVNNGEVTGVTSGETQVKANIAGKEAVCNVTVIKPALKFDKTSLMLKVGESGTVEVLNTGTDLRWGVEGNAIKSGIKFDGNKATIIGIVEESFELIAWSGEETVYCKIIVISDNNPAGTASFNVQFDIPEGIDTDDIVLTVEGIGSGQRWEKVADLTYDDNLNSWNASAEVPEAFIFKIVISYKNGSKIYQSGDNIAMPVDRIVNLSEIQWERDPFAIPSGTGTFTITLSSNCKATSADKVIFTGNFETDPWLDSDRIMTNDGSGSYRWTGRYPENFIYKIILRTERKADQWIGPANSWKFDGKTFTQNWDCGL